MLCLSLTPRPHSPTTRVPTHSSFSLNLHGSPASLSCLLSQVVHTSCFLQHPLDLTLGLLPHVDLPVLEHAFGVVTVLHHHLEKPFVFRIRGEADDRCHGGGESFEG